MQHVAAQPESSLRLSRLGDLFTCNSECPRLWMLLRWNKDKPAVQHGLHHISLREPANRLHNVQLCEERHRAQRGGVFLFLGLGRLLPVLGDAHCQHSTLVHILSSICAHGGDRSSARPRLNCCGW
eukprot:4822825-Amphidinium_carterae.1